MAKWYGKIGYAVSVEVEPGFFEDQITEHSYYGDIIRNFQKNQNSGGINDNVNISNQISVIADLYANQNISKMVYVEFMGTKWKISDIEVQYPRLILSVGGVYNGQQTSTAN